METTAAPSHAPMLRTSRTRPRMKAINADRIITASTTRSTDVIVLASSLRVRLSRVVRWFATPRLDQGPGSLFRSGFRRKSRDQIGDVANFLQRQPLGSRQFAI